jgi:hypothetical protein
MRTLLRRLEVARDMALRGHGDPERAVEIHERTLRAIMSRDYEEIEVAMNQHMSYLEDIWERESGRARLREIPPFLLPRAATVPALVGETSATSGATPKEE